MKRSRTFLGATVIVAAAVVAGGIYTRPGTLAPSQQTVSVGEDLDAYLAEREARTHARYGVIAGAGKRIRWHGEAGTRTPLAVIYLHGFSASRQEIAPVAERVADALGANLFETRLAGHGRIREPMAKVQAEEWLEDGAEALAVGRAIGERLVVIGTSTGATLALAMAEHPHFEHVESLVFVSPNWGPAAGGSDLAVGPYGPQLVRLLAGEERSWNAENEQQERFWSTRYPTDAVIEMMRLVKLADSLTERAGVPNALLIYSPRDDVVSVPKLLSGFERLPAERKAVYKVDDPRSLSPHVIAGRILAPDETGPTVEQILEFLKPA